MLHSILTSLLRPMHELTRLLLRIDRHSLVDKRSSTDSRSRNMIPTHAIREHHVKRRCRRALFAVPSDLHTIRSRTAEEETAELARVSVIVKEDVAVGSEEGDEVEVEEEMDEESMWLFLVLLLDCVSRSLILILSWL